MGEESQWYMLTTSETNSISDTPVGDADKFPYKVSQHE